MGQQSKFHTIRDRHVIVFIKQQNEALKATIELKLKSF
jgi:hypothetical protein